MHSCFIIILSLATINPLVLGKQDDGMLLVVKPARDTKNFQKQLTS